MPHRPGITVRSMALRLDAGTMDALESAATAHGLSREAYVRQLIEHQLGIKGVGLARLGRQGMQRDRYAPDTADKRVLAARSRRPRNQPPKRLT